MLIAKIRKNMTKTRTRSKLRRILPTYLPQQWLHLVGVTLNTEQQIRVPVPKEKREEEEEKAMTMSMSVMMNGEKEMQVEAMTILISMS